MQNQFNAPFSVAWEHRLCFTNNSFDDGGDVSRVLEILHPVKVLPVLDLGLTKANKSIFDEVCNWSTKQAFTVTTPLTVTGGEDAKNDFSVVEKVLHAINNERLCRKSCVLVIGGGAVLDAVGFATSIAHRGIPLVRMPTTTLSACDSGMGVKNGVNYFGKKNFIGVFDPPFAVINDFDLLKSLDDRHWRSGLSEAVKVSLIKDPEFFKEIESKSSQLNQRDMDAMSDVIKKSALLHLQHITEGGDPFERLEARPLDFGHWSAHKLEQLTSNELTHGEAVAIGLAIDVQCSVILGYLQEDTAKKIIALLLELGLPISHPSMSDPLLLQGIEEFREHLGGTLTLLMLRDIGDPINIHELDAQVVRQAVLNLL